MNEFNRAYTPRTGADSMDTSVNEGLRAFMLGVYNKMALGLVTGECVAGILIVPNMKLAQYLTDRIGNIEEIRPYLPMWKNLSIDEGVLELVVIEQDGESTNSPRIPKGKDGRAKEGMLAALAAKTKP